MALALSRWRIDPALSFKDWGEELVVFCDATGDTLLIDTDGAALLAALREAAAPLSLEALAALVLAPEAAGDSLPLLAGLLEDLEARSLVQRVAA